MDMSSAPFLSLTFSLFPSHSCGRWGYTLLFSFHLSPFFMPAQSMPISSISRSSRTLMIYALNLLNNAPCSGFFWTPPHQHLRHWTMLEYPLTRWYLLLYEILAHVYFCVLFVLYLLTFFSSSITLILSWYNTLSLIPHPCASNKYLYHSNYGIELSLLMSYASI